MANETKQTLKSGIVALGAGACLTFGGCLPNPRHEAPTTGSGEPIEDAYIDAVHDAGITAVAFSADGSVLASASADGTVILWDVEAGAALRQLPGHPGGATAVAFSPGGTTLVTAGADGTVRQWNSESGEEIAALAASNSPLRALEYSPEGSLLAAAGEEPEVWLWRAKGDDTPRTLLGPGGVVSLAFSPDGRYLYLGPAAISGEEIWRLDLADGTPRSGHRADETAVLHDLPLRPVLTLPDVGENTGRSTMAWTDGEVVLLGDPVDERVDVRLKGHSEDVTALATSADGRFLASGAFDKTVVLWDLDTREEVRTLYGHALQLRCLAFSPDGSLLASGSTDRTVRLWEVETGRSVATLGAMLAQASEMWQLEVLSASRRSRITHWFQSWSLRDQESEFLLVETKVTNRLAEPNILYGSSLSVTDGSESYSPVGLEGLGLLDNDQYIRVFHNAGDASTQTFIFVVPADERKLALRLMDLAAVDIG